ncbi:MAG: cellulase family glycosylhydrolase [Archangiaceae bacterium]|nr:cellulase family glycosylhydrolase [Archangiaceae bacterium]
MFGAPIPLADTLGGMGNAQSNIMSKLTELLGDAEARRFRDAIYDDFITEADIAELHRLGFNSVRVPFNHLLLDDERGWQRLDTLVEWCGKHGVYAILDLHSTPGGQCRFFTADADSTLVWEDAAAQDATVALWQRIAERYRGNAAVGGYDLINEPCKVSDAQLVAFYGRLITAVRAVDPGHLLFIEGNANASDFKGFTSKPTTNMVYSFHMYGFLSGVTGDKRAEKLAEYVALAKAQDVPLWVGEFGQDKDAWVSSTVEMYKDAGDSVVGWSFWPWKRAASDLRTYQNVTVPPKWLKVMKWVVDPSAFNPKPSLADAMEGEAAFLEAVKLENCDADATLPALTR